jgi:type III restriction enzyme
MSTDNPILNSPYVEPLLHYNTDSEGSLDYTDIRKGRRIFKADSAVIPTRQTGQKEVFEIHHNESDEKLKFQII